MKATLLLLLSTTLGRSRPRTAHPAPVSAAWRGFAARIVLLFVFAAPAFADSSTGGTPSSAAESLAEPNPHAEGAESAEPVPAPVENHAESAEPVPTPVENHAESAESAEPVPAPVENHAEGAESAEPVPAPVENHAESAESAEPVPTPVENHAEGAESAEPVPAPVENHAEGAEPVPAPGSAPVENHAEGAESAEPVPAQAEKPAKSAKSDLNLGVMEKCGQVGFVDNGGGQPRCGGPRKAAGGAAKPGRRASLQSRVRLSDGSILKGTLRRRFLPADTDALGRIRIDLAKVESIAFLPTSGGNPAGLDRRNRLDRLGSQAAQVQSGRPVHDCRITFRNGDRLTVRFPADLKPLRFDTVLGPVPLPLSAVSKLVFEPSTPSTSSTLLYHCTFDSASSIEHPAAGPAGRFLRGSFVPGKKGRALLVKARTPAAEVPFPTGLMQPEGCIEFWARIPGATKETRYPDGGNPMFFAMGVGKWVNTFVKYTANDGFGTGGLHADLPGSAYVSTLPSWSGSARYPDFLGDPSAWHHYALVWSEKGLDAASEALGRRVVSALYVDGRLVNPAYGTNGPDRARFLRQFADEPVVLGFPFLRERQDPKQGQVDYLIDEFKIWNFPKTDFAVFTVQPPTLLYHCTFDDGAAIEHPAAGPTGTFLGGEFVPGKKGNALRIPGNVPTALVDLPRGMMQPRGTIEFWSKIEDPPASYGDRGNPRFFGLSLFDDPANPGPCSTYLQFTSNDGMGMSGLCGMIYHRAMATDPHMRTNTYGPLLENPAAWHHYAIVWDSNGLSFSKASDGTPAVAAIVLDGRVLQTFGRNQSAHGKGLLRLPELQGRLAFPVADTGWGFFPRPVAFLIDEFKIWSVPKTDFGIDARPVRHYKPQLLYHCTFDSAEAVEKSAAGPNGKFLGGEFVPGKVGNALRSPGDSPVAEVDLSKGLLQPRGTIEFWAKIEEPPAFYGDRGNPLFFGLWLFDNPDDPGLCSTHLGWCANNGMGMAGLCGMIYHRAMATDPTMRTNTYGPLLSDPAAWHHYAIVWDSEGLPFAKASDGMPAVATLVLDGRILQTFGRNELARGKGLLRLLELQGKLAFPVPAARWGNPGNHVPFLIDEFKIWSAPKTDFAIPPAAAEPPRLLYHCTFDDAAAIERPAAGPSGTFLGGTFEEGKAGNALRVRKGLSSAIVHFEKGVLQPRGMIEFWAKIENDREHFGDGGDPRFFMMETAPGSETVFQLAANDGCGRGGLSVYHQGISVASENHCLYPANYTDVIPGDIKGWHHYALVWDESGVAGTDDPDALAAFIDGNRIPLHGDTGLAKAPRMASRIRDNPVTLFFSLNPELDRGFNNKSDFLIDEFKIWSAPKSGFQFH